MLKLLSITFSLFLITNAQANNEIFSAEKFIKSCLQAQLSDIEQVKCSGFLYGLLSSKQNLMSDDELDGVGDRATNTRKAVNNYALVKRRNFGLSAICVPAGLTLMDFRSVIRQAMDNSKIYDYSVEGISNTLAYSYQCPSE